MRKKVKCSLEATPCPHFGDGDCDCLMTCSSQSIELTLEISTETMNRLEDYKYKTEEERYYTGVLTGELDNCKINDDELINDILNYIEALTTVLRGEKS